MEHSMGNKKNKKWKWIGGVILAVLVLGAGVIHKYKQKHKLESPVFYRYLYERYLPTEADSVIETSVMVVKYFTNVYDKREVTNIVFKNAENLKVEALEQYSERYGLYKQETVRLYMEWNQDPAATIPESVHVNTIQVEYSDGSRQTVDIGSIGLYSGEEKKEYFDVTECMPLFDDIRIQTYSVPEEIEILGVPDYIKDSLKKLDFIESLSLTADGRDLLNQKGSCSMQKGSLIDFRMKIREMNIDAGIPMDCEYDSYQVEPKIIFRNASGKQEFQNVHIWPVNKQFESEKEVKEYLKTRR